MSDRQQRFQIQAKYWLGFLPEIKAEIQSFLELPQNANLPSDRHLIEISPFDKLSQKRMPFSQLQKCLSRLDNLPEIQDILNETDTKKLRLIFGEFQQVKFAARVAILTIRTNIEQETEDRNIHSWAVDINPFFYVPARLFLACKKDYHQISFAISLSPENISTSIAQMNLPRDWEDPIKTHLRQLNLFQATNQLFLDGIDYELSCHSRTSKSIIKFGNPSTSPLIEMERAFFSIAEMVANKNGQQAEKNYLDEWRKYIER